MYAHVRLKYSYPVGEPKEIVNPLIDELPNLFGLIKVVVVDDGKVPFGIPCKVGKEFNRMRGRVLYQGTTEELKNYVRLGANAVKILKVLHYDRRQEGKVLFGESIEEFDSIKREGTETGNKGKRDFGKLGCNSGFGKFGLDWDKYGITSSDNTSITVASFISAYARIELMNCVEYVQKKGGTVYYTDTDSLAIDIKLLDCMVNVNRLGYLKFEGSFDVSCYLGKKQFYLYNSETGEEKKSIKGYGKDTVKRKDWFDAQKGIEKKMVNWERGR